MFQNVYTNQELNHDYGGIIPVLLEMNIPISSPEVFVAQ